MDIARIVERRVGPPLLMLHDRIYKGTNGRIGHVIPGIPPSLIVHTIGARTGQKRANTLSYAKDGDAYLVVASKGGDPRAPGWYHNLRANPNIEIKWVRDSTGVITAKLLAEKANHHPDWSNSWNKVTVALSTHSAGGVTASAEDRTTRAMKTVISPR